MLRNSSLRSNDLLGVGFEAVGVVVPEDVLAVLVVAGEFVAEDVAQDHGGVIWVHVGEVSSVDEFCAPGVGGVLVVEELVCLGEDPW